MADQLLGATLGAYRIEGVLGRGGGGTVFRARHQALGTLAAVKVFGAASPGWLEEARAAAQLRDPRVVQVIDAAEQGPWRYVVMELVDGETLADRVGRTGPMALRDAVAVLREVLKGLQAAHARGLVHRDVKPANVMLPRDGGVKLLDFGLAARAGAIDDSTAGSFDFMAPEKAFGAAPDPREDLYAAGGTLYFCLTGRPPYDGTPAEMLLKHRSAPVPELRERCRAATPELSALTRRLLAKDPAGRPASAAEVLAALEAPSILLELDPSGSPFTILPPPPEPAPEGLAADPEFQSALSAAGPAAAPMPPPPPALPRPEGLSWAGLALLGAAFAWFSGRYWPSAGVADVAGLGAASAALLCAAALGGEDGWRRRTSGLVLLAVCAGAWLAVLRLTGASPSFESAALGGVGTALGLGGLVLAFFAGRRERGLGCALLAAAAAAWAWAVPGGPRLLDEAFSGDGARRWGGLAAAWAFYAIRRACG